jgi:hypothetical protein
MRPFVLSGQKIENNSPFEQIFGKIQFKSGSKLFFFALKIFFFAPKFGDFHNSLCLQRNLTKILNYNLKTLAGFSTIFSTGKSEIRPQLL